MIFGMKVKTSITLSDEVVLLLERHSGQFKNRSDLIETAIRSYIAELDRKVREDRDIEIINRNADRLNEEAMDVLSFQVEL